VIGHPQLHEKQDIASLFPSLLKPVFVSVRIFRHVPHGHPDTKIQEAVSPTSPVPTPIFPRYIVIKVITICGSTH
jgi:hypothetical protein